jgi:hypothetical protein
MKMSRGSGKASADARSAFAAVAPFDSLAILSDNHWVVVVEGPFLSLLLGDKPEIERESVWQLLRTHHLSHE